MYVFRWGRVVFPGAVAGALPAQSRPIENAHSLKENQGSWGKGDRMGPGPAQAHGPGPAQALGWARPRPGPSLARAQGRAQPWPWTGHGWAGPGRGFAAAANSPIAVLLGNFFSKKMHFFFSGMYPLK